MDDCLFFNSSHRLFFFFFSFPTFSIEEREIEIEIY